MDHYKEQLVILKKTGKDRGIIALVLAAALLIVVGGFFLINIFPPIGVIYFVACAGVVYGGYWVISGLFTEMEYCVTNGDIDIDKITGRRKRRRVVSVRGDKIESLEPFDGTLPEGFDRTVMAASSLDAPGCWRFTYYSKKNGRTQVIFEPEDAVLDELVTGLSRPLQLQVKQVRGTR